MKTEGSSKERIMESGIRLFAKKGFSSVGMRELSEDAGVNLAMINYFFGSKKGLLKVILDNFFTGYIEIMETNLQKDVVFDQKITDFVKGAIGYIEKNRDGMIVVFAELPHDDPEITEYKANWAKKAMVLIRAQICIPLQHQYGVEISPAMVGPPLIGMMASRFLFAPVMEHVRPPGYGEKYFSDYPDHIAAIILNGLHGLAKSIQKEEK